MRSKFEHLTEVSLDVWDRKEHVKEHVRTPSAEDRWAAYYLKYEFPFWREGDWYGGEEDGENGGD